MIKIGITGNIASGKSEVEKIINNLGYKVYDLDILSKEIFDNKKDEIIKLFNTIDRKEIAKIVFSNLNKKKELENLIYPTLKQEIEKIFKQNHEIVFISGALLYEGGFDKLFDKIIFVDSDFDLRLSRLQKRNNLTKKDALLRMNTQNNNFKNKADFIINNNSTIENLENEVKKVLATF